MLIQLQLLSSVRCSFFPSLLCRCDPADSNRNGEKCKFSPVLSVLPTRHMPLDFCIYACVTLVHDPLELWSKNPSFFQKYTWTADLDQHSFSHVLLPFFVSLLLVILKIIGHTGIAGTKKWLDQAVFPCWSNYHTLAGE